MKKKLDKDTILRHIAFGMLLLVIPFLIAIEIFEDENNGDD